MPDAAARETYPTRRNIASLAIVTGHVIFVLAPIYLAASFRPTPILVLFWLWFGLSMHGLLNMMHECAHYHAFRGRRGSDLLGRWVLAPLMFADFDQYRLLHWAHHRTSEVMTTPSTATAWISEAIALRDSSSRA
jgi:fatty acid desaturase